MDLKLTLNDFSGPLDLLLGLLDQKKLTISEIALSEITEQYIHYLDTLSEEREQELADFLVIATKLLLLKSQSLLPQLFPEEEGDGPNLEEQLRLYKRFQEASKRLNDRWEAKSKAAFRIEPPRRPDVVVFPPGLVLDQLHQSMVQLVDRLKPLKPLPKTRMDSTISIKQKIQEIHTVFKKTKRVNFFGLIRDKSNKTELIVGFLALLELVKQRQIGIKQEAAFGEIVIRKV